MNRLTVYRLLSGAREVSKAEVSRLTGISGTTVLKIMDFFIEAGLVHESGEGASVLGRKPHMLRFNPDAGYAVGAVLEGHFLNVGLVNLSGNVVCSKKVIVEGLGIEEIVGNELPAYIEEVTAASGADKSKILAAGVGVPAAIMDAGNKKIVWLAPVMGLGQPIRLREEFARLERRFGVPFLIENDVNVAAIGEYMARGRKIKDMGYISLGAGLGAGIILDGRLRRGVRGSAGEISYMVFDQNHCSRSGETGWLEQRINVRAVRREFGFSIYDFEEGVMAHREEVIGYITPMLALGIVNFAVPLDLELVAVGGVFAEILGQELIAALTEKAGALCYIGADIQMRKSGDPGVVGAAMEAIEENLSRLLGEEGAQ
ncbi:MAG: ROK family protein [Firmicutes bacterium]|nr:ROK family protein [Bacillota bacterium]